MNALRRVLYVEAGVWAACGAAMALAPRFVLVTLFTQPPLGESAWLRLYGIQSVGLGIRPGHRGNGRPGGAECRLRAGTQSIGRPVVDLRHRGSGVLLRTPLWAVRLVQGATVPRLALPARYRSPVDVVSLRERNGSGS